MKLTDADDDDGIQADATSNLEASFELNDTLYSRASISPADTEEVYLWLGANVMLAYPIAEAEDLLQEKLSAAQLTLSNCEEDQEFLREQITVCPLPCPGLLHEWYTNRSRRWRSQRLACITGMWCSGGMTRQKGKEMRVGTPIRRALVVNLLVCFAFLNVYAQVDKINQRESLNQTSKYEGVVVNQIRYRYHHESIKISPFTEIEKSI